MGNTVVCNQCFTILDERSDQQQRNPCPVCGSIGRSIYVFLEDQIGPIHDSLGYKMRAAGKGMPVVEAMSGDDMRQLDGKCLHKERIIDRKNNKYVELLVDKETGKILKKCEEPLSQHKGHGSDKK